MDKFAFNFKHKKSCGENIYVYTAGVVEKGANSILLN